MLVGQKYSGKEHSDNDKHSADYPWNDSFAPPHLQMGKLYSSEEDQERGEPEADGGAVYVTEGSFRVDDPDRFIQHFFQNVDQFEPDTWVGSHLGTASRDYQVLDMSMYIGPNGVVEYEGGDPGSVAVLESAAESYGGSIENASFTESVATDGGT